LNLKVKTFIQKIVDIIMGNFLSMKY